MEKYNVYIHVALTLSTSYPIICLKRNGTTHLSSLVERPTRTVKQPELVSVGDTSNSDDSGGGGVSTTDNGVDDFPRSGKEAIREWKPHLIYVQGGNTFWLHHCMEKGNWSQDLIDACCNNNDGNDTTNNDVNLPPSPTSTFPAVYCGVSAGAILTGQSMQTACWKVRYRYAYAYAYTQI